MFRFKGAEARIHSSRLARLVASASAGALLIGVAGAAQAQDAQPPEDVVDEIVVTGFRASLAQALDIKRDEIGAVDAIVAEDIADFPDLNLAEAIQRIPGVAITRDAGEGRNISVRGLGPDFTRIRVNGMEAISTTGGTDSSGGANRSRGFDFNVFAAELFNSIIVRKSPSADIEEGSLGATVDLQAARPFDYRDFTLAVSGQGGWNDLSESFSPRGAFLISNTWADGRFGALLSVAYSERDLLEEGHSTVRWQSGNMTCSPLAIGCVESQIDTAFTPRLPRYGILEHAQERLGITGSLQWRPTDATLVSLDLMYGDLSATRAEHFLEVPDFSAGGAGGRAGIDVVAYERDGNTMTYGIFDDVDVRSESRFDVLETIFQQSTLSIEHDFSDRFSIDAMIGMSSSEHSNPIQTTLLFDRTDTDGFVYDYRGNDRLPLITYGFDVTDPASWTLTQIRIRPQYVDNTYDVGQINARYDWNDSLTLHGGLVFKRFTFDTEEYRRDPASCALGPTANAEACIPGAIAGTPISSYSRLVGLADQWDIPSGTTLRWLIPDYHTANDLFGLDGFPVSIGPSLGNNRSVEEEDTGAWGMLEWESMIGGGLLRGNAGLRYVRTDQYSTGYQLAAGAPVFTSVEREYEDWLPSINLVWEASDTVLLRGSAARVMTRPGLGSLTPGGSVSVSGNNRTVNSGNPFLDPTRGNTFDMSVEWYFADDALLSFGFFYKSIDSFVANQSITQPFTGNSLGLPDSVAIAACGAVVGCSPAADWNFNQPVNTDGGTLHGIELNYQQPFDFLPGIWSNFGVIANYTYVDSEIEYPGGIIETLTGLSKNAYNATLYYEDEQFSARISGSYRDRYLTRVPGQNGNSVEGQNSSFNVDAAASWQVNDRIAITFEAINLTDEANNQYVDATDRVYVYHHTGRQFFAGFRWRY